MFRKISLRTIFSLFPAVILCCYIASCSTDDTAAKSATRTDAAQIAQPTSKPALENTSEVIISWKDKKLTLQQISWMYPSTNNKTIARAANWWLENELLYAEAEKRGITKEPKAKFIAELTR